MFWQAYVITSKNRVDDGSFQRFITTSGFAPHEIILGFRGEKSNCPGGFEKTIVLPSVISLSEARNQLLEKFPPEDETIVCFPDDDCWYSSVTREYAANVLDSIDFVIGVVDRTGTEETKFNSQPIDVNPRIALRGAASAAIFCRSETMRGFLFDTQLGLGAKYRAAEDLDLIFNFISKGFRGVLFEDLRVGHPDNARTFEYFPGSVAVMRKYIKIWPKMIIWILRRIAHGLVFFLEGKLSYQTLVLTVEAGIRRNGTHK